MLYNPNHRYSESPHTRESEQSTLRDDLWWMFATMYRYRATVATIALFFVASALLYVALRPPAYTAVAQVQISNLRLLTNRDDTFFAEAQLEPRFIETQLQIFRSERIGYSVVDQLKLTQVFSETPKSSLWDLGTQLRSLLGVASNNEDEGDAMGVRRRSALRAVQRGFSAEQVGPSEVVEVKFTSDDRDLSALIANDLVRAYIAEQETARSDSAQAGSSWLRERLREVGPRARILTVASPPLYSSNMRGLLIIAVAGMLGAILGSFAALCRGLLDRQVRSPEHVSAASVGKFLGIVPRATASENGGSSTYHSGSSPGVPPPEWYTFRDIRAVWDREPSKRGLQTLGVVSTQRGEGRSHVAADLARNIGASGQRVLLVDADPLGGEAPGRHAAGSPGLVQWLEGEVDRLSDIIVTEESGAHYLPSGHPTVAGYVDWNAGMGRLIETVAPDYEYLLFDLPPLAMAADVGRSTAVIEDYLLVIGSGAVQPEHINCALSSLALVRSKLIGYVLNNVDLDAARWLPSVEIDLIRQRSLLNTPFSVRRKAADWLASCRALPRACYRALANFAHARRKSPD
jgi:Mrp family chromosome partitioning ATPase/capsular polysaccharide biosynthesis protein